jgi:hypothetical protein
MYFTVYMYMYMFMFMFVFTVVFVVMPMSMFMFISPQNSDFLSSELFFSTSTLKFFVAL